AALESQPVPNPERAQIFEFGPESQRHRLLIPPGVLATSYGTAPDPSASLRAAVLDAASAPAGMQALVGNDRISLRSFAIVEVRADQPGADLQLRAAASLSLPLGPD